MQCPITSEQWQRYQDTGDARVAAHIATCSVCREEATRYARLLASLATLPMADAAEGIAARLTALAAATEGTALGCAEVLDLLEAWREGELPSAQAFLVEDHLLWCEPCTQALAQADALTQVLLTLPALDVPDAVAERVAAARIPWWRRLLPAPAPTWSRQMSFAVGFAALLVCLFGSGLQSPQVAQRPAGSATEYTVADKPPTHDQHSVVMPIASEPAPVERPQPHRPIRVRTHRDAPVAPQVIAPPDDSPKQPEEQPQNPDLQLVKVPRGVDPSDRTKVSVVDQSAQEGLTQQMMLERLSDIDTDYCYNPS